MSKYLAVAVFNLCNEVNVGSIIRSANAFGVSEIVIIGRKKYNEGAATGGQAGLKIRKFKIAEEFLEYCKVEGFSIVSLEISKDSQVLSEFEFPQKTMLVLGNEGQGVPDKILEVSDATIRIPQFGDVECLNVAISGSIACYEWAKKNLELKEKKIEGFKFC